MSRYDPQGIYSRPSSFTKTGQIIQKKPYKAESALTHDEIPRSLSVLQTFGYSVYSPGTLIFNQPHIFIPFSYYYQQVTLNNSFLLSNLYINIEDGLNDLKKIPLSSIRSSIVKIGITHVKFTVYSTPLLSIHPIVYHNGINQNLTGIQISTSNSFVTLFGTITSQLNKTCIASEVEGQTSSTTIDVISDPNTFYGCISYVSSDSLWPQLHSGNITDDYGLFSIHSVSQEGSLLNYVISGFVYISLNL